MKSLNAYKKRTLLQNLDFGGTTLDAVAKKYSTFRKWLAEKDGDLKTFPEDDAIWFYMTNHAMSLVYQKVDAGDPFSKFQYIADTYFEKINVKFLRMFYYMLIITTRESRHGKYRDKLYAKYPAIKSWHKHYVQDTSSPDGVSKMLNHAPAVPMKEYGEFLVDAFTMCSYNGGYGGEAWAEVATPLRDFINGTITAEMLMDTAFTLCHNNGPIFNKGMLFESYSGASIYKILDVQRAGMIPQLVYNGEDSRVTHAHREFQETVTDLFSTDEFSGYVDWYAVEALGALKKYPKEKAAQASKHGVPDSASAFEKLKLQQEEVKAKKAALKDEEFKKKYFEIMPGVHVEKCSRGDL